MGRFDRSGAGVMDGEEVARRLARAGRAAAAGESARALALFREIIAAGPGPCLQAACVGAGNAHLAAGRYELATGCFEQALTGGDEDLSAEALQNLGIARYVGGDRWGACVAMQELAVLGHPVLSPLARDNLEVLFGLTVDDDAGPGDVGRPW